MIDSPSIVIIQVMVSLEKLHKHERNIAWTYLIHETAQHVLINTFKSHYTQLFIQKHTLFSWFGKKQCPRMSVHKYSEQETENGPWSCEWGFGEKRLIFAMIRMFIMDAKSQQGMGVKWLTECFFVHSDKARSVSTYCIVFVTTAMHMKNLIYIIAWR